MSEQKVALKEDVEAVETLVIPEEEILRRRKESLRGRVGFLRQKLKEKGILSFVETKELEELAYLYRNREKARVWLNGQFLDVEASRDYGNYFDFSDGEVVDGSFWVAPNEKELSDPKDYLVLAEPTTLGLTAKELNMSDGRKGSKSEKGELSEDSSALTDPRTYGLTQNEGRIANRKGDNPFDCFTSSGQPSKMDVYTQSNHRSPSPSKEKELLARDWSNTAYKNKYPLWNRVFEVLGWGGIDNEKLILEAVFKKNLSDPVFWAIQTEIRKEEKKWKKYERELGNNRQRKLQDKRRKQKKKEGTYRRPGRPTGSKDSKPRTRRNNSVTSAYRVEKTEENESVYGEERGRNAVS